MYWACVNQPESEEQIAGATTKQRSSRAHGFAIATYLSPRPTACLYSLSIKLSCAQVSSL